jgi:hypothetical protein
MSYRIQVNKKKYYIRIKNFPETNMQVGVSVWRNRGLRFGTMFSGVSTLSEIKVWAKAYIKANEGQYFTR